KLVDFHYVRDELVHVTMIVEVNGVRKEIKGTGNGRLDSVSTAIKTNLGIEYTDLTYSEHALSIGSSSKAITYLSITLPDGNISWGAGVHDDIIAASVNALFSAINRTLK
ncbi:MAG: alpha-isopropylmalate synthase regulatory domain-containing protein, partial [Bacillota bacterium]|nr:alpha-isopropylmalate synthase regulatory domain-containing protein [Bacillota bacterium]